MSAEFDKKMEEVSREILASRGWTPEEIEESIVHERASIAFLGVMFKFSDAAFDFALDAAEENPYLTEEELRSLCEGFDACSKGAN